MLPCQRLCNIFLDLSLRAARPSLYGLRKVLQSFWPRRYFNSHALGFCRMLRILSAGRRLKRKSKLFLCSSSTAVWLAPQKPANQLIGLKKLVPVRPVLIYLSPRRMRSAFSARRASRMIALLRRSRLEIGLLKRICDFLMGMMPLCNTLRLKRRMRFSLASLWSFLVTLIAIMSRFYHTFP